MQNNNAPFKPIMQSQWNFVSIEFIQIVGSVNPKNVLTAFFYRHLSRTHICSHMGPTGFTPKLNESDRV